MTCCSLERPHQPGDHHEWDEHEPGYWTIPESERPTAKWMCGCENRPGKGMLRCGRHRRGRSATGAPRTRVRHRYFTVPHYETVTPAMVRHAIIYGGPMRTAGQKILRKSFHIAHELVWYDDDGNMERVDYLGETIDGRLHGVDG